MGKYNISIPSSKSLLVCVLFMCLSLSQAAAGMNDDHFVKTPNDGDENILQQDNLEGFDPSKIVEEYKTRLSSPSLLHQSGGIYYPNRNSPSGPNGQHHGSPPTAAPRGAQTHQPDAMIEIDMKVASSGDKCIITGVRTAGV
ncbi:unnamed protein product [Cuscuta epithymum]|uniref:Uncharacterized protein n=1 Tax=Cuscuta epithymum TaxID=186058 RepID=A0AAV0CE10_9ASTE|nr:unnamed protein product [Cuscuta epithymum]